MASYKNLLVNEYKENRILLNKALDIKKYLDEKGELLPPELEEYFNQITLLLAERKKGLSEH